MLKLFRAALSALILASIATQPVSAQTAIRVAVLAPRPVSASIPFITSVESNGWAGAGTTALLNGVTFSNVGLSEFGADTAQRTVPMARQGYDSTGTATTISEPLIITKWVRQAATAANTWLLANGSRVAFNDFVYSTDTLAGGAVTNNSTETSPVAVAQWATADHQVVANTLTPQIVAVHRNGVAAVVVTAVDSTASTCATATSSSMTVAGASYDLNAVLVYAPTLNLTSCAAGTITVNAKVYPRVGTSGSVLDSSTNAVGARAFAPQVYHKNTSLATSPRYAYVATTGVDASCVSSTTASTAAATPCLTIKGAIERIKNDGTTVDGGIVRIGAGTFNFTTLAAGTYQTQGELIIERDPGVTRANAIVSNGAGSTQTLTGISWLRLRDVKFLRVTNSFSIRLVAGGFATFENVDLDNASFGLNHPFSAVSGNVYIRYLGVTITNPVINSVMGAAASDLRLARGVTYGTTAAPMTVEGFNVLGSRLTNVYLVDYARGFSGGFIGFNKGIAETGTTQSIVSFGLGAGTTSNFAEIQNEWEWSGTAQIPASRKSNDAAAQNTFNILSWHNSYSGAWNSGRFNNWYDELVGTFRTHRLNSIVGNIEVSPNVKQDQMLYSTAAVGSGGDAQRAEAGSHVGGMSIPMGVGSRGEFFAYADSTGGYFGSANSDRNFFYPGISAKSGAAFPIAASTIVQLNPRFVSNAAVTVTGTNGSPTYTAGAGGGDYRLQRIANGNSFDSPAIGMVPNCPLPFDINGNARAATCSAGANE